MKLSRAKLQKVLNELAEANAKAWHLRDVVAKHCEVVYGVDPADIDNDLFIDAVDGGCGKAFSMSVDDFHESMVDCMGRKGISLPDN